MKNEINAVLENMTTTIAREPPARNGKPPKSGADTLTPWKN